MKGIRCRLGLHDWRFLCYVHSHLRDGEMRDAEGRLVIWRKEFTCSRCYRHEIRTYVVGRVTLPPVRNVPRTVDGGKDWDAICYTVVPDRHGEGMDDYCTHPRYDHLIFGEPVVHSDDKDFWTWYEGPCQHCHCDWFTPA